MLSHKNFESNCKRLRLSLSKGKRVQVSQQFIHWLNKEVFRNPKEQMRFEKEVGAKVSNVGFNGNWFIYFE